MKAKFKPCQLNGRIEAPPSKSMAHRYLVGAALAKGISQVSGIDYSEDILASLDCLQALGAKITIDKDVVTVDSSEFMNITETPILKCRESGSTLRFFIPLSLCLSKKVTLTGSRRLLERPLDIYEELCRENGFTFEKCEGGYALKSYVGEDKIIYVPSFYLGEPVLTVLPNAISGLQSGNSDSPFDGTNAPFVEQIIFYGNIVIKTNAVKACLNLTSCVFNGDAVIEEGAFVFSASHLAERINFTFLRMLELNINFFKFYLGVTSNTTSGNLE